MLTDESKLGTSHVLQYKLVVGDLARGERQGLTEEVVGSACCSFGASEFNIQHLQDGSQLQL